MSDPAKFGLTAALAHGGLAVKGRRLDPDGQFNKFDYTLNEKLWRFWRAECENDADEIVELLRRLNTRSDIATLHGIPAPEFIHRSGIRGGAARAAVSRARSSMPTGLPFPLTSTSFRFRRAARSATGRTSSRRRNMCGKKSFRRRSEIRSWLIRRVVEQRL